MVQCKVAGNSFAEVPRGSDPGTAAPGSVIFAKPLRQLKTLIPQPGQDPDQKRILFTACIALEFEPRFLHGYLLAERPQPRPDPDKRKV
jgi:hypothetical protein